MEDLSMATGIPPHEMPDARRWLAKWPAGVINLVLRDQGSLPTVGEMIVFAPDTQIVTDVLNYLWVTVAEESSIFESKTWGSVPWAQVCSFSFRHNVFKKGGFLRKLRSHVIRTHQSCVSDTLWRTDEGCKIWSSRHPLVAQFDQWSWKISMAFIQLWTVCRGSTWLTVKPKPKWWRWWNWFLIWQSELELFKDCLLYTSPSPRD